MISVHHLDPRPALGELSRFRREFHRCLTRRADGLFELADAVLCADGPVRTLVGLSLAPEHRRGHGGLYDAGGLPVRILGRMRSDRVLRRPTPPRVHNPAGGRFSKHGAEFVFGDPVTWNTADVTRTDTRLYGSATAQAWNRLHPRLTRRAAWIDHDGPLPVIEGTVIRLTVERLPSGGVNTPVWLWCSDTDAGPAEVDRYWQMFLRRFDIEHTFRMLKQTLGWTRPRLRDPEAANRWTWLILAVHAQLRLARPLVADLQHPWERPAEPTRLTPARVRRGFRNLHTKIARPAAAPKHVRPGPGRPAGSRNRVVAQRFDVGLILATGQAHTRPAHHKKGTKPRQTT